MNDTHPDIHRRWIELLREAGPQRRLQMALDLTEFVVAAARDGIARAQPDLSPLQQRLLLAQVTYGKDLADQLRRHLKASDMSKE